MSTKTSFIIHLDSLDVIDDLSDEQCGELLRAMKAYHLKDDFTPSAIIKVAFSPFKNQFVRDQKKYESIVERNRINGLKGGRPLGTNKPTGLSGNPDEPKKADSGSKSDNDSDNKELNLLPENLKVSMPSDFTLNDTNRNWINDSGLSNTEKHEVVKDFIDYWTLDESKKTAKGWQMSFRKNPIVKRKIVNSKHRGKNNGSHQQAPKLSLAERATEARKKFEQQIDAELMGEAEPYLRT